MKVFQNPVVVGILAVFAVLVIAYQFGGAKLLKRNAGAGQASNSSPAQRAPASQARKPAAPRPAAPSNPAVRELQSRAAAVAQAVATTNLPAELLPEQPVDESFVGPRFANWVKAPLRDPFLLLHPKVDDPALLQSETNSPVRTWTLKAIWNQTDSRLAVINNRVYRVGDVVQEGYKLVRIEKDEVWFEGPARHERLGFPDRTKAAARQNTKPAKKPEEKKSVTRRA